MANIMEKVKDHFRNIRQELREYYCEEWDETIYFKPMNLEENDRIFKYVQADSLEMLVQTLIVRALDADGNKMFKNMDRKELMKHADPRVITKICEAMSDTVEEPDELEKN